MYDQDDDSDDLDDYQLSDLIDENEGFDENDYEVDHEGISWSENYQNCIHPTLSDTFQNFLLTILFVNISLKVILTVNDSLNLARKCQIDCLIKLCGGLYLIYDFFRDEIYIGHSLVIAILTGTLLIYILAVKSNNHYNLTWLYCFVLLLSNEILIAFKDKRFRRLRAIMMLLFMKFVSLRHHLEETKSKEKQSINFLDCLVYMLHPQSLPLGAWNPMLTTNAQKSLSNEMTLVRNFLKYAQPFVLSLFFLICSNCLISHLMSLIETNALPYIYFNTPSIFYYTFKGLLNAYFVALQFRCSHYFISYTMQYVHYLWNHDVQVTKVSSIEFPRSLVEVVIAWNMPMHKWLKIHLYSSLSIEFGDTKSRFLTFIISSLMHGYDFRIWSVLLTLAFLTWVEMRLRKNLSIRLNSCVEARRCEYNIISSSKPCVNQNFKDFVCSKNHLRTPYNSLIVNLINLFFSLLAIVHLAFLGSAFDGNEENGTLTHVHEMWSFLHYYSFVLFVPTFIAYKLLSSK